MHTGRENRFIDKNRLTKSLQNQWSSLARNYIPKKKKVKLKRSVRVAVRDKELVKVVLC